MVINVNEKNSSNNAQPFKVSRGARFSPRSLLLYRIICTASYNDITLYHIMSDVFVKLDSQIFDSISSHITLYHIEA